MKFEHFFWTMLIYIHIVHTRAYTNSHHPNRKHIFARYHEGAWSVKRELTPKKEIANLSVIQSHQWDCIVELFVFFSVGLSVYVWGGHVLKLPSGIVWNNPPMELLDMQIDMSYIAKLYITENISLHLIKLTKRTYNRYMLKLLL